MIAKLPHKIKLSAKDSYDVVIVPRFEDELDVGHCDPNIRQIRLIIDSKSERQVASTLFHECLHYINFKYNLGLTEDQVLGLESGIIALFRLNHRFTTLFLKTFIKRSKIK